MSSFIDTQVIPLLGIPGVTRKAQRSLLYNNTSLLLFYIIIQAIILKTLLLLDIVAADVLDNLGCVIKTKESTI